MIYRYQIKRCQGFDWPEVQLEYRYGWRWLGAARVQRWRPLNQQAKIYLPLERVL
jgi:hypothetical protein